MSAGVPAVALPEVFLGLVPGWGGCWLLPNLIGVEKALTVIIDNPLSQNRMLTGVDAYRLGMADALFEPADFLEESVAWAARVLSGETTVERPEVDRDETRLGRRRSPGPRASPTPRPAARPGARMPPSTSSPPPAPSPATRASPPRTRCSPTCS